MSKKGEKPLSLAIGHLSRLMTGALNEEIRDLGVAPGQVPVLMCLWQQDGLNQRELYERVNIEQATMSNTLKRMERDGLIRRKADPNDRRAAFVLLTAKAKKLEPGLAAALKAVNKRAQGALKKKDRKAMAELVDQMIANLTPEAE